MRFIKIFCSLILLAIIIHEVDIKHSAQAILTAKPQWLLLACVTQLISALVAACRWQQVMKVLNMPERLSFYIKSYLKGTVFNQVLPTSVGGDAFRVLEVASRGHGKKKAFLGVLVDRIYGTLGLLLIALLTNIFGPKLLPSSINRVIILIALSLLTASLLLLGFSIFYEKYLAAHSLKARNKFSILIAKLLAFAHDISSQLRSSYSSSVDLTFKLGLSLLSNFLTIVAVFCLGQALQSQIDLLTFLIIVPPVTLLTLVPISLAGWGVREGAMIGLFSFVGATKAVILSISLLYGLVLIIASLPGLVFYMSNKNSRFL